MKRGLALMFAFVLTSNSAFGMQNQEMIDAIETPDTYYCDVNEAVYKDEILQMSDYGVINGYPDNTYRPYSKISRAEMAVILSRFLSVDHNIATIFPNKKFSDVESEHWASREILYFADNKVISGYGDNTYNPEEFVTFEQAVKMLVAGMGYDSLAVEKGGFPIGYLLTAAEKGILNGITAEQKENFNRDVAAKLLYNTLKVKDADGKIPVEMFGEDYFYVSPDGDDNNPGTEKKPWKTLKKAAQSVIPGGTVIFEDGVYNESSVTTILNSGTEDKPITFKARNKHAAIIKYGKSLSSVTKFQVTQGIEYVNIRDFLFTQETRSTSSTSDIYIRVDKTRFCVISGNKFENVYEEGIKLNRSDNVLIEDNYITGDHEAMDIFASSNITIRGNECVDCGRVALMLKGNSNNMRIYNNYVHNETVAMTGSGIDLGGSSDNYSPYDIGIGTGWENYYSICYNNVVVAAEKGLIPQGFSFISSIGCQMWNNVVVNCDAGIKSYSVDSIRKGWPWNPPVTNPVAKNNIIVDCDRGIFCEDIPGNPTFENNLFDNVKSHKIGGFEGNANFVDKFSDWHLLPGSDAIDRGLPMPEEYVGYKDQIVKPDLVDHSGNPREGKWDLGIYNAE